MGSEIIIDQAALTDVGSSRDRNEDAFAVMDLTRGAPALESFTLGSHGALFVVCDGMGGMASGDVASQKTVDVLREELHGPTMRAAATTRSQMEPRLLRACRAANTAVHDEANSNPDHKGMGSTMTAVAVVDDHLLLAQVGDSRAYLLRAGKLTQITRDQSLVFKLLELGKIEPEDVANFDQANVILQGLGRAPELTVEASSVRLAPNDRLLICSDGLTESIPDEELAEMLGRDLPLSEICEQMIELAKSRSSDNITTIVVSFAGPGLLSAPSDAVKIVYPQGGVPPLPDPRGLATAYESTMAKKAPRPVEPSITPTAPVVVPAPTPEVPLVKRKSAAPPEPRASTVPPASQPVPAVEPPKPAAKPAGGGGGAKIGIVAVLLVAGAAAAFFMTRPKPTIAQPVAEASSGAPAASWIQIAEHDADAGAPAAPKPSESHSAAKPTTTVRRPDPKAPHPTSSAAQVPSKTDTPIPIEDYP